MYEEYHYNQLNHSEPFQHWPPEDGLPDRIGCLMAIVSGLLIAVLVSAILSLAS